LEDDVARTTDRARPAELLALRERVHARRGGAGVLSRAAREERDALRGAWADVDLGRHVLFRRARDAHEREEHETAAHGGETQRGKRFFASAPRQKARERLGLQEERRELDVLVLGVEAYAARPEAVDRRDAEGARRARVAPAADEGRLAVAEARH